MFDLNPSLINISLEFVCNLLRLGIKLPIINTDNAILIIRRLIALAENNLYSIYSISLLVSIIKSNTHSFLNIFFENGGIDFLINHFNPTLEQKVLFQMCRLLKLVTKHSIEILDAKVQQFIFSNVVELPPCFNQFYFIILSNFLSCDNSEIINAFFIDIMTKGAPWPSSYYSQFKFRFSSTVDQFFDNPHEIKIQNRLFFALECYTKILKIIPSKESPIATFQYDTILLVLSKYQISSILVQKAIKVLTVFLNFGPEAITYISENKISSFITDNFDNFPFDVKVESVKFIAKMLNRSTPQQLIAFIQLGYLDFVYKVSEEDSSFMKIVLDLTINLLNEDQDNSIKYILTEKEDFFIDASEIFTEFFDEIDFILKQIDEGKEMKLINPYSPSGFHHQSTTDDESPPASD